MKTNKVFSDAEEKYVKTTIVYATADDGELYYDAGHTTMIAKDDLFNMFLKGMVIMMSDEYLKPVAYKESAGAGMVTAVHENSTVIALNFYSAEHAE